MTQPMTLQAMMAHLRSELEATNTEIERQIAALARQREHAAYVRGQLEAYASIQLADPQPATMEHGQEVA